MESDINFDEACRCCLTDSGLMKNMLVDYFVLARKQKINLIDGYSICAGIDKQRSGQEKVAPNICEACEKKLTISYEFRELCQHSDRIFQQHLEDALHLVDVKVETPSDEELKEVLRGSKSTRRSNRSKRLRHQFSQVYLVKETSRSDETEIKSEKIVIKPESDDSDHERLEEPEEYGSPSTAEPVFVCFHCDRKFSTHTAWTEHETKKHHQSDPKAAIKRTCLKCEKKVKDYVKHILAKHKQYRPNKCNKCPEAFVSHTYLKTHLISHEDSSEYTFKCMISDCEQKFPAATMLRKHVAVDKHIPTDNYRCPYCGLDFQLFLPLHQHFKTLHDRENIKKIFPCFKCKKICMFQRHILEHSCDGIPQQKKSQNATVSGVLHKCIRCAEAFDEEDALVCHQHSVCLDEPKFICHICEKVCINQRRLTAHKRTHKGNVVICDECGYTTHSANILKRHKDSHSNERKAKCHLCSSIFKNEYALKQHQIIHQDRKYECHHCAHKFRSLDNLKHHLSTHNENAHMRKHSCEFCDTSFMLKRDKDRHLRSHTDERLVKCKICLKDFRDTGVYNEHHRRVHEGISYECKYCVKRFSSRARLKEHLFVHRGFSPYNCVGCPQKFLRKYLYVKHLLTHNIKYAQSIHGYRETEDLSVLIAESVREQTAPAIMSLPKSNVIIEQTPEKSLVEFQPNSKTTVNTDSLEQWNRSNMPPYSYGE